MNLKSIKNAIHTAMKIRKPVMLWGPPGVGKSEAVRQIANEQNRPVIDIRLLLMEPTDLRGIPYFSPESRKMEWADPSELPEKDGPLSNAILFLDEISAAAPNVQAAAYQLVLDRKVGQYELPEGVDILAAGNRAVDRSVAFTMPAALANRFIHLEVDVDYKAWEEWAMDNDVHSDVIGFLGTNQHRLFNEELNKKSSAFETPRSWVVVSDVLKASSESPYEVLHGLVAGAIGEGAALEFEAHRKLTKDNPNPHDILSGKVKEHDYPELSAQYSSVMSCHFAMKSLIGDRDKLVNALSNFMLFFDKNATAEIAAMGIGSVLSSYMQHFGNDISDVEGFDYIFDKYSKYILGEV